jgi:hypothetical protein
MVWRWRLKSELDGANEMKVILLVKVASEARDLRLHVEIGATPARRRWLIFRDLLPALPGQPQVLPVELAHPVQ